VKDIREYFVTTYSGLSEQAQATTLTRLLFHFTLLGRDTYVAGTDDVNDAAALRKCNEAQHRIASQLLHLLQSDARRYPDDVFAHIVIDQFESLGASPSLVRKIITSCTTGNDH
jgi:hypothetical protein